jgi:DNA-directed RNA polymerase subunit RPC12/RpoP
MKNAIDGLQKTMRANRRNPPRQARQFEELEASSLFCVKCKQAVPVRKKLLLVLPEGEKYDYLCAHCGSPVGSKTSREDHSLQILDR